MDEELIELLEQVEDHRLEFKGADFLEDNESIAKQLVAFANRRGGKIVIGITDDRELEGSEILGDIEAGKISRIARSKCSPPVDIDHTFHPNQYTNNRKGDVLVITVNPASTPTAVVDGTSRTYYLRTTNESRPVEDPNELNWLYTRDRRESIVERSRVWLTFDGRLNQKNIEPHPESYTQFRPFIEELSREDRNYLLAHPYRLERYICETTPFAFLLSLEHVKSPTFWISYAEQESDTRWVISELLEDCDEITLDSISYDTELRMGDADPPIHQTLSIDLVRIFRNAQERQSSVIVPESTTLSVSYENETISHVLLKKRIRLK